jgi:hypothetical protein
MQLMKSDSIGALALALSKVQGKLEGAKKDIENKFLKNKYADLSSCWDAIRKELALNELSVVQSPMPSSEGSSVHLMTTLLHSSGEWISSEIMMPVEAQKGISMAQSYGIVMTYARRYALAAVIGITQDDDDGNGAAASGNNSPQRPATPPAAPRTTNPPPVANTAPAYPKQLVEGFDKQAHKLQFADMMAYCKANELDYDYVMTNEDFRNMMVKRMKSEFEDSVKAGLAALDAAKE